MLANVLSPSLGTNVNRSPIMLLVFLFAFANGVSETVFRSLHLNGFAQAFSSTFGISVIVFIALFFAIQNLSQAGESALVRKDVLWLCVATCLALIPSPQLSWIAITGLALYEQRNSAFGSARRRGAALMLGLTIPMFWGKITFAFLSSWILRGDALLVAGVTHTSAIGNMVSLPHQAGFMTVAPACSSFSNISLAVLCWLIFTEYSGRPRDLGDYVTCFSACINVVIVNVARISLIGYRPDLYDLLHGPTGASVASWVTALVVLATCYFGVKRERPDVSTPLVDRPASGIVDFHKDKSL